VCTTYETWELGNVEKCMRQKCKAARDCRAILSTHVTGRTDGPPPAHRTFVPDRSDGLGHRTRRTISDACQQSVCSHPIKLQLLIRPSTWPILEHGSHQSKRYYRQLAVESDVQLATTDQTNSMEFNHECSHIHCPDSRHDSREESGVRTQVMTTHTDRSDQASSCCT
jgi:hypothetical protein